MATCPICESRAEPRAKNPASPFCSARCKTIDLGRWLSDAYRVPVEGTSLEDDAEPLPAAIDGVHDVA